MIPIRLTLQGLYSYQEKQTIDFTKLTEANLFGIFGSVGSGKSTILEAITYALYGKTDRLNQNGDNRNYNMMNLKSNDLFIEFVFCTGKGDAEYMATVKGRRNSKQFEEVKALDRSAYKKANGEWTPMDVEDFASIIGLSYENFKRTVIIPQGRFQEFLQLGNSDRTKMMKELFNLEKFELFYKVVSLESKNNQQLTSLLGQVLQIGEINSDQIQTMENDLAQLKVEIAKKTQTLKEHQKTEEQFRKQKELTEKITQTSRTLDRLKIQEPEYTSLEKVLQEYDYCLLNFKNLFESEKNSSDKIVQYEKNIQTDREKLYTTLEQLKASEIGFSALKTEFDNRENYHQQAEELDKIANIRELELAGEQIKQRLTNGETVLTETDEKIKQLHTSKIRLNASLREIKEQMPDLALLAQIKSWFTFHNTLLITQKGLAEEQQTVLNEINVLENQKNEWEKSGDPTQTEIPPENKKAALKMVIERLNKDIEHLSVQTKLEEYAASLEEGHECPLCGALNHPSPLNAKSVSQALQKIRLQKAEAENNLTGLEALLKKLSELHTTLQLKKEAQQSLLQKQKDCEKQQTEHQKLFTWTSYPEETSVNTAFENANKLQQQLQIQEAELELVIKTHENEILNKEKYNKGLDELRLELAKKASASATQTSQLQLLKPEHFENKTTDEILKLRENNLLRYREIGEIYAAANEKITSLTKEKDTLNGKLLVSEHVLKQELLLNTEIKGRIQTQLEKSEYTSLFDVETVLASSMNTEAEKNKLHQFKDSLKDVENQLTTLQKELSDQTYDEQNHLQVLEQIRRLSEELSQSNQKQGKIESDLERIKADYQARKALIDQTEALKSRAEDLKTLKQLFKASGFVNYISSVYLQELCRAGNDRFYKLTRQKLSLEVTDDNNFQVRDFMNGGKTRNVKTLSGGQTFQAALSLALALADNIQKITESNQNFFFLDEGFGSLDKESLDVVFDTLKSLRKENRIVGVISHVEEMQQEIDTHLKIVNDEERGSLIQPSWKDLL